jgi:hypothetical protein
VAGHKYSRVFVFGRSAKKGMVVMKVSVDVYTKDVDAALVAFKAAIESGATDVRLNSSEDYDTRAFSVQDGSYPAAVK